MADIRDYGAVGDGATNNTAAITSAVTDCGSRGGGQVVVAGGSFLTGSLVVNFSNIELHLAKDAVLLGSQKVDDYPLIAPLPSYGVGRDVPTDLRYRPLIFGQNVSSFSLTGTGIVDGQGEVWWLKHFGKQLNYSRPRLVECMFCTDFLVEDVTLKDSPFWTLHPYASVGVTVQRVTVTAPGWAPNTDGVDPDSCKNVLIKVGGPVFFSNHSELLKVCCTVLVG